ncbi:histidine kinase [Glaciimonas sp. PCH181]|nr:histidine kinase [Glaciimonas sp. PCH181]
MSVSIPSTAGSGSGTGTGDPAGTTAAAGDPGTSAFNTKATVEYGGTYTVKSAPPITAPSLTTTLSDTCMGSVSFGLSLTGFGATAASTMVDQACVRRLDSREFRAMGLNDVALALLCQSDANRKAVEATGHDCPGMARPAVATANTTVVQQPVVSRVDSARVVDTTPPPSAAVVSSVSTPDNSEYRDPYVRRRLGLEPLQDETAAK